MSIITFNVGGMHYCTTRQTLEARGENMLSRMVASDVGVVKDQTGAIFIDRSGKLFALVLDYLRSGKLPQQGKHAELLKDELSYYAIEGVGVLLSEISDTTLRERLAAQEGEVLTKYASATAMVVRAVLEDLTECVEARGYRRAGAAYRRNQAGGPVFLNRRMPKELVAEGPATAYFRDPYGVRLPTEPIWAGFIQVVERWVKSPDKSFTGDFQWVNGLQWPGARGCAPYAAGRERFLFAPCVAERHLIQDVHILDIDDQDFPFWTAMLTRHFLLEYKLTVTAEGAIHDAAPFQVGIVQMPDTRHLIRYARMLHFSWNG